MMGHSLAEDGDLTYRRDDLVRVWREFPSGPAGVFLKRGRTSRASSSPRVRRSSRSDQARTATPGGSSTASRSSIRCPRRRSSAVRHQRLSRPERAAAGAVVLCGVPVPARPHAGRAFAALLAAGFVLATVVPVYFVWIMPELFNFSLVLAGVLLLAVQGSRARRTRRHGAPAGCSAHGSDLLAAALLGLATFSKPSNAAAVPADRGVAGCGRRRWRARARRPAVVFARRRRPGSSASTSPSRATGTTRAGERNTLLLRVPVPDSDVDLRHRRAQGARRGADRHHLRPARVLDEPHAQPRATTSSAATPGLVAYFFPAVFALAAFSCAPAGGPAGSGSSSRPASRRSCSSWSRLPYTWIGGGGRWATATSWARTACSCSCCRRSSRRALALVPWIVGALFIAPLVLNPFVGSFRPGDNAKRGPLRMLPVELTLSTTCRSTPSVARAGVVRRQSRAGRSRLPVSFLDDNAYGREADKSFWVRGESRAEFLSRRTADPEGGVHACGRARSRPTSPPIGGRAQRVHLDAGETQQVTSRSRPGLSVREDGRVGRIGLELARGFTPIFHDANATDARYLGVRVKPCSSHEHALPSSPRARRWPRAGTW